jgi:hypothetical protein
LRQQLVIEHWKEQAIEQQVLQFNQVPLPNQDCNFTRLSSADKTLDLIHSFHHNGHANTILLASSIIIF